MSMKKQVRVFRSHQEADAADHAYYQSLTPEERLNILLELVGQGGHASSKGFRRVYSVVKLGSD